MTRPVNKSKVAPGLRFERLCGALCESYLMVAGPDGPIPVDLEQAALREPGISIDPLTQRGRLNVARAFVRLARAAEHEDPETMFGACQLAKVWGFDWRSWLRTRERCDGALMRKQTVRANPPVCWLCDRRLWHPFSYVLVTDDDGTTHPAHESCAKRPTPTAQPTTRDTRDYVCPTRLTHVRRRRR